MRGLRTIPVFLDILRDMSELCPTAFMLNYANPMSMLMWAGAAVPTVRGVGLCHSVDNTVRALATYLDVPYPELTDESAGVNHLAFITRLERHGQDLIPAVREFVTSDRVPETDLVRAELCRRLGYYPTSPLSTRGLQPWFIPKNLVDAYRIPIDELILRDTANLGEFERIRDQGLEEDAFAPAEQRIRGGIIDAIVTDTPPASSAM